MLQYCLPVVNATVELLKRILFTPNQPNPFSGQTTISYELQQAGYVSLRFNLAECEVARLADGLGIPGDPIQLNGTLVKFR